MIPNSCMNHAHVGWKIRRALRAVRIKKEKGVIDSAQSVTCQCPVYNGIVLVGGVHIIDILRIIHPADRSLHAYKLPRLLYNITDIASLANSSEFSERNIYSVHDDGCYCTHSIERTNIPPGLKR